LQGGNGGGAGREDDQDGQGKYVLRTPRQVVDSLKGKLSWDGQARPAAKKGAPPFTTTQLAWVMPPGV